jgi:hypothetical protein
MSSEELIGLVCSLDIRYEDQAGYAIAVTSNRVVGAVKPALSYSPFGAFLDAGSKASDKDRQKAQQVFLEVLSNEHLELVNDSITRISWKKEGFFRSGYFLFNTTKGDFLISVRGNGGSTVIMHAVNTILGSLVHLAPDRVYNEKTGVLVRDEVAEKIRKNPKRYGKYDPSLS